VLEHKVEDSRTDFLITLDMASLYPQMGALLGKTRLKKLIVGKLGELSAQPDAVSV
jgi:long-chain acyl-CoA synthetase